MRDISNQHHSFSVAAACKVGVNCAVILQSIYYWVTKNEANGNSYHDGRYWTYNSVKAFSDMFPYLSKGQIDGVLKRLERDGYIVTGNYNKVKYDRTKWYALTDSGYALMENAKSISKNQEMDSEVSENGLSEDEKPIPVSDTVTDPNTDKDRDRKRKRFTPPTRDEVAGYIHEMGYGLDPDEFMDKNEMRGWKQNNGQQIVDWRACVRMFERNRKRWASESPSSRSRNASHGNDRSEPELVRLPYGMMPASLVKTEEEIERMTQFQRDCYYHNARTYQRNWEAEHGSE